MAKEPVDQDSARHTADGGAVSRRRSLDGAYFLRPICLPGVELVQYADIRHGTRLIVPWYCAATLRHAEGHFRYQSRSYPCPLAAPTLLNPEELFLAHHSQEGTGPAVITHLQIAPEVMLQAYRQVGGRGLPRLPIAPRDGQELGEGLLAIEQRLLSGNAAPADVQQAFTQWLALLLRNAEIPQREPQGAHEPRAVALARELLHERLDPEFGLGELATTIGLSKPYLVRAFKRELGLPPHEYQMQLRVARARKLLAAGMAATEVAHEAGFYDQSHLTRWFKKVVGVTPGNYALAVR